MDALEPFHGEPFRALGDLALSHLAYMEGPGWESGRPCLPTHSPSGLSGALRRHACAHVLNEGAGLCTCQMTVPTA